MIMHNVCVVHKHDQRDEQIRVRAQKHDHGDDQNSALARNGVCLRQVPRFTLSLRVDMPITLRAMLRVCIIMLVMMRSALRPSLSQRVRACVASRRVRREPDTRVPYSALRRMVYRHT